MKVINCNIWMSRTDVLYYFDKIPPLCVKFQPPSTPPSERFWLGVLVVVVFLLLLVTGVKQSPLLVYRLSLEFDKNQSC